MADYKSANIFRTDYKSMRTKSSLSVLLRPSVRYRFRYSISFRYRYRFRYFSLLIVS